MTEEQYTELKEMILELARIIAGSDGFKSSVDGRSVGKGHRAIKAKAFLEKYDQ